MGPRAGLEGGKSRPNRDLIPGPSIPTELPDPVFLVIYYSVKLSDFSLATAKVRQTHLLGVY